MSIFTFSYAFNFIFFIFRHEKKKIEKKDENYFKKKKRKKNSIPCLARLKLPKINYASILI